jgi:hypothetical protein
MSFWDKVFDLLQSSAVTQGVLSILIVGAYFYMLIAGIAIPSFVEGLVGLVVGFFFGGKVQAAITKSKGGG